MKLQDPITQNVANAIGMTVTQCEQHPRQAARKAASKLRANGYQTKCCHRAWERGVRWYYKDSDVPESDYCATSLLGIALIQGRIVN